LPSAWWIEQGQPSTEWSLPAEQPQKWAALIVSWSPPEVLLRPADFFTTLLKPELRFAGAFDAGR
jgi:hypothetical protein